ncbi:MAG: Rod shape-determining protein RodA, partial [uncultured Sphingomonadaceae bacterium]
EARAVPPRARRAVAVADAVPCHGHRRLRPRRALFGGGRFSHTLGAQPGRPLRLLLRGGGGAQPRPRALVPRRGFPGLCAVPAAAVRGRSGGLRRQGRAALDRPRLHPAPAVRVHEDRRGARRGPLLRSAARRRDPPLDRDMARWAADQRTSGAGDAPARPRHFPDDHGRRRDRYVPRRAAATLVRRQCSGGRGGDPLRLLFPASRVSAQARHHLSRTRSRPARRGLPHHPVQDRDRFGRRVRQGLPPGHAEPPRLPAGGPYRLRLRHHGGGMGAAWWPAPDSRLCIAAPLGHGRGDARGNPLRPADRRGADQHHLPLFLDQPADGDGPRPGSGHPAAALLLRRVGDDDGDVLPRHPDVHRPGEQLELALV